MLSTPSAKSNPQLIGLRCAHGCNDAEHAIGQQIGCEQQRQRQHGRDRPNQSDKAEQDSEHAAQGHRPPVLGQHGAHRGVARVARRSKRCAAISYCSWG